MDSDDYASGMTAPSPEELAKRIRPSLTRLYVLYFRIAAQSDLTGSQLSLMSRMQERGAPRISELAHEEGIRLPTASNALHQLEERGLVARIRDKSDKRGIRVKLTKLGERELARVGEERDRYVTQMLKTLDPELLKYADKVTEIITALADAYDDAFAAELESEAKKRSAHARTSTARTAQETPAQQEAPAQEAPAQ